MKRNRQNPEQILQRVQEEERTASRGKLKIYLGAAPGVGKTYEMLHHALEKRINGFDVVIGVVESHGRQDIELMLKDFEVLPRQSVEYHGKQYLEFSLEKALHRAPGLILMDELAHTNIAGLRHSKRWQDVNELLDRGIDVYTTLNVQHIESIKDLVAQIIKAPVKETVPDFMIEQADSIELIDLPPDDLLKRLEEGKVYVPEQAVLAREHFFRKGNLIALRELALRIAADHVRKEVLHYRHDEGINRIWPTKDKILVCVGSKPESHKLIRAAKRMASGLQAEWLAVFVDTPRLQSTAAERNVAVENLRLAELLGAETHVLTGGNIVKDVLIFAREHNVTQIMIWKHIKTRWQDFFRRTLADEMLRQCGEIDVYIMTGELDYVPTPVEYKEKVLPWKVYGFALVSVISATLLNLKLYPILAAGNALLIYVIGIFFVALFGKTWPAVFASILSVLAYTFFFVQPFYSFAITRHEYFFIFVVMILVTQIMSYILVRLRRQVDSAQMIQRQTTALYTLSRQLTRTRGVDELLELGTRYIASVFNCDVLALLPKGNHFEIRGGSSMKQKLEIKEQSIAQWVYEMGQRAGSGTDTLSFSNALFLPLKGQQSVIGVLRIQPKEKQLFTPEQMGLLETCMNQLALALEVDRLQENTRKRELKTEADRARSSLLTAISHDLDTPLKVIINVMSGLKGLGGKNIKKIEKDIDLEVESLSRLNNNIVQMIQLEAQTITLEFIPFSLEALIDSVIETSAKLLELNPIHKQISSNIPLVPLNKPLMLNVLVNLIDNAVKYTSRNSSISIAVFLKNGQAVVSVEDSGPGIILDERDKLFEKFYRGKQEVQGHGLGLGLAICQKIVNAHGGKIWVENIKGKGAAFCFSLPLHQKTKK